VNAKLFFRRLAVIAVAVLLLAGIGSAAAWRAGAFSTAGSTAAGLAVTGRSQAVRVTLPPAPKGLPVLANSCSAGYVTFTFDDGPDKDTLALASELLAEHVPAVFFEIGDKVAATPGITRLLAQRHFVIGDHTWDHASLTGASTKTKPLTDAQVKTELTRAMAAVSAAGAPRPKLWRAPYDDVSQHDVSIAASLGLRLVMSYGLAQGGNIDDSQDWSGNSAASVAAHVDTGYTLDGSSFPGMRNQTILSFHDGINATAPNTIKAIPVIVAFMNRHHLCATSTVRPDATGGVVSQTSVAAGGE
jgi:peptidoglycan/xylan/chitin deacetylase (PgdA/CDA1 family)